MSIEKKQGRVLDALVFAIVLYGGKLAFDIFTDVVVFLYVLWELGYF